MQLDLLYPTASLKSVKVGIFSSKIIRFASDPNKQESGELIFDILESVCFGVSKAQLKEISLIDANRIVIAAWKQSHRRDVFAQKVVCSCGKLNIIEHSIDTNMKPNEVYTKEHIFNDLDPETLAPKLYKTKLKPVTLQSQVDLLNHKDNMAKIIDLALWSVVDTVNAESNFNKDNIPYTVVVAIQSLVAEDMTGIANMFSKEDECWDCKSKISHTISVLDVSFLENPPTGSAVTSASS